MKKCITDERTITDLIEFNKVEVGTAFEDDTRSPFLRVVAMGSINCIRLSTLQVREYPHDALVKPIRCIISIGDK